ncbi:hypothetical protein NKG05_00365 [Oerskovia sp. M15]
MVRTEENAGMPPVTVLFDRAVLPPPGTGRSTALAQDGEWAVDAAASIGVALLGAAIPSGSSPRRELLPSM